ncbi:MAG TPA: nucleotidyl transferase AbiEii/AbiGii toxin family protein [Gemmatimonadaceae bacterium]|nr:nucleotidyl transferase AbiEii/AbiGii toxin family protein [Gemmatimonadaceae bacterium]
MNEDYRDFLVALDAEHTRFLVVGAHALAVHGYPRATVDIDIWVEPNDDNADRVWQALAAFGPPLEDLDIDRQDFTRPDVVAQLGLPPNRIDIVTGVSGLTFEPAWNRRVEAQVEGVTVPVLAIDDLVANKTASGRENDRADIRGLQGRS